MEHGKPNVLHLFPFPAIHFGNLQPVTAVLVKPVVWQPLTLPGANPPFSKPHETTSLNHLHPPTATLTILTSYQPHLTTDGRHIRSTSPQVPNTKGPSVSNISFPEATKPSISNTDEQLQPEAGD